ncbi:MAG: ribosome recycling factor [Clostridia bacterium]|nr:ribosome recycling factor [Clostridia bacterium]
MKFDCKPWEEKMQKSLDSLEDFLQTIRASLANAGVLSRVTFEYYGVQTKITDMAEVRVTDPRTLMVKPYDKNTLKAIEKAILTSDVGVTPQNDGTIIRLNFPQLTEERRKELTKQVTKYGEEAKVAIRNIRRDANDAAKKDQKDSVLTEDEEKTAEKDIQNLTDKFIKKIDDIVTAKNREVMAI